MNPKHTVATVTALRRPTEDAPHAEQQQQQPGEAAEAKKTMPG